MELRDSNRSFRRISIFIKLEEKALRLSTIQTNRIVPALSLLGFPNGLQLFVHSHGGKCPLSCFNNSLTFNCDRYRHEQMNLIATTAL